jgi:hypothetical protein
MIEEWKTIPGTSDLYQASTLGRIRSLDRIIVQLNRWGYVGELKKKGRVLKPWRDCNGYEVVYVCESDRREAVNVHRLVAMTYLEGSGSGLDVNHKDGCKTNNSPENLEWCTRKENMAHAIAMGLVARSKPILGTPINGGEPVFFESASAAGKRMGASSCSAISNAANGKLRQAYGFFWKYQL